MIRAIIFDFDGVILESADIKTRTFGEVVRDYPEAIQREFVEYHMNNMGVSRYVKFEYLFSNILHENCTQEKIDKLAFEFEKLVYKQVMECQYVPGSKEYLKENFQVIDFYIASGTPENELHRILRGRDLERYFKMAYGTPAKKEEIINSIIRNYGYKKEEVLFVGDAGTDKEAAVNTGLTFVGRNTSNNTEIFKDVKYRIDDIRELVRICRDLEN